jgi:hypothetical protein
MMFDGDFAAGAGDDGALVAIALEGIAGALEPGCGEAGGALVAITFDAAGLAGEAGDAGEPGEPGASDSSETQGSTVGSSEITN